MKTNKIKLMSVTVLTALTLGTGLAASPAFAATEGTKDLIIHKMVNDTKDGIANNGTDKPAVGDTILEGAGFTVYDVTANFYTYFGTSGESDISVAYAAYVALLKNESNTEIAARGTIFGSEIVDGQGGDTKDGQVKFVNLPKKTSAGQDAIYAVLETTVPANEASSTNVIGGVPTIFAMPLNGDTDTINLYPKNQVSVTTKTLVSDDEKGSSDQTALTYNIGIKLPNDLGTLKTGTSTPKFKAFAVKETPGTGLILDAFTKVTVPDDKTYDSIADFKAAYGLNSDGSGIALPVTGNGSNTHTLTFTPSGTAGTVGSWASLGGKTLTFQVTGHIDVASINASNIATAVDNKVTYTVTDDNNTVITSEGDDAGVKLGAYKFAKTDSSAGTYLSGAKFSVKQDATDIKFLKKADGVYIAVPASTDGALSVLDVSSEGKLTLLGLDADKAYALTETQAPAGYFALTSAVAFTPIVDDATINSDASGDKDVNSNKTDGFYNIYNTQNNILPSTGGTGFMIFGIVAAVGLGGAGMLYTIKRKAAK